MIGDLSIRENIILALQGRNGIFKYIPKKRQAEIAEEFIKLLDIQTPDAEQEVSKLGGLYLARGMCYLISIDTISITHPLYTFLSQLQIKVIGDNFISINVVLAFFMILVGAYLAHYTKFGRTVYAIGGNEQSTLLMGLPVARTKVLIYAFNGFCAALSGIAFTFYMRSGYALHGTGMEMDAIASVAIGGTLLTGGYGYVIGTVFGVLISGTIQYLIMFQGTLNAWWTKITIGFLVCVFCLLQRFFAARKTNRVRTAKRELKVETPTV